MMRKLGTLIHTGFLVESMERSIAFFSHFNLAPIEDHVIEGQLVEYLSGGASRSMRMVMLKSSPLGAMLELIEFQTNEAAPKEVAHASVVRRDGSVALMVDDLAASVDQLRAAGIAPLCESFTINLPALGTSRVVFYGDPDGHMIELLQMQRESRPAR